MAAAQNTASCMQPLAAQPRHACLSAPAPARCSNGKVPVVSPHTLMPQVLVELTSKSCGCVLVADEGMRLCGIFTDGDLRRSLQQVRAPRCARPCRRRRAGGVLVCCRRPSVQTLPGPHPSSRSVGARGATSCSCVWRR